MINYYNVIIDNFPAPADYVRCGAYSLTHLKSNKVYYGSSKNIYRRMIEHRGCLSRGTHSNVELQKLIIEDPNLIFNFYQTNTVEEAIVLEQQLIDNGDKTFMLNVSPNAKISVKDIHSVLSVKEKISKAKIGNKNALGTIHTEEFKRLAACRMKGNLHLLGHKHSDETKIKMSMAHKGRKLSQESISKSAANRTKHHVCVDDIMYLNAAHASRIIGLTDSGIIKRCKSPNFPNYKLISI